MNLGSSTWQFSVLGLPARLAQPWALAFFAVVVVAALLWVRMLVSRARSLGVAAPERLLARMAPKSGLGRDLWGGGSTLLGLLLLCLAAAQPQCGTHSQIAKRYGMDVVIAIDASNSMLARDVKPSRIERAKLELSDLIDRLHGDRVGIVAFAGDAFVQCPLTTDYSAAKLFLRAIEPKDLPQQGTALAEALQTAETLFKGGSRGASGRAIVLITDGEDHEGGVGKEADHLADEGVRIFAVGIGSQSGEPIPLLGKDGSVVGYMKDRQGRTVMTRLNEEVLRTVTEKTHGKFVTSEAGDLGVGEVNEELSRMDKAEYQTRLTVQYDERYQPFAWAGLGLVCLGLLLGEGRFKRRRA